MFFEPLLDTKSAPITGATLAALAMIMFSFLVLRSPWTIERPQPVGQFVLHDVNTEHSYWASEDIDLSSWHQTTLGSSPKTSSSSIFQPGCDKPIRIASIKQTEVAHSRLARPELTLIALDDQKRQVSFRVRPGHPGDSITVWLEPGTEPLSWSVEGHSLALKKNTSRKWYSLTGFAIPAEGVVITLTFKQGADRPEMRLTSVHNAIPKGLSLPVRNDKQVRGSSRSHSDSTITFETIVLPKLIAVMESE